ncbi:LysE family translocator [Phaeobacter porticola]|uniref:Putative homoserine/homoserine lactone efflux protein n=1 Tax=Phaeobacter porticola TaxID=1844006 RepID=A0A1L3I1Y0_9RHOB|nr:LysE family translocator [Phaeobacter porticola]APG46104.1 putative homoserine/homoserine lactone efflux protein [Phaeobacter porticola]
MTIETMFALLLFLFPLAYSPGPGNLFFAANGARFGFRATLPATLGYHIATAMVTLMIGSGLLAALISSPAVFQLLKWAGAGYMLWIAWGLWRAGGLRASVEARPARFRDGAVLLLLNPKAYVIIAVMFSQFLPPGDAGAAGNPETINAATGDLARVAVITLVFTLNNLLAFSIWTLVGDGLARQFAREPLARQMNRSFALLLAAVAAWMLLI